MEVCEWFNSLAELFELSGFSTAQNLNIPNFLNFLNFLNFELQVQIVQKVQNVQGSTAFLKVEKS